MDELIDEDLYCYKIVNSNALWLYNNKCYFLIVIASLHLSSSWVFAIITHWKRNNLLKSGNCSISYSLHLFYLLIYLYLIVPGQLVDQAHGSLLFTVGRCRRRAIRLAVARRRARARLLGCALYLAPHTHRFTCAGARGCLGSVCWWLHPCVSIYNLSNFCINIWQRFLFGKYLGIAESQKLWHISYIAHKSGLKEKITIKKKSLF